MSFLELISTTQNGKLSVQLGIRIKIAGLETLCPVSRPCDGQDAFKKDAQRLTHDIQQMQQQAQALFGSGASSPGIDIRPDMPASEIWDILSTISDDGKLSAAFNDMDESQRRTVAEHALTQCNIFSGKAAVFSKRYDSETGLMS